MSETKLKPHKLAEFFPMLEGREKKELHDSLKAVGQKQEIVLFEDKILDGRNRYEGCLAIGIKPRFKVYKGKKPLTDIVWPNNMARRNLTPSQLAAAATEMLPEITKEAGERKAAGTAAKPDEKGEAVEVAAAKVGVGKELVRQAATIKKADKKLFKKVAAGKVTVNKAHKQVAAKAKAEKPNKEPGNGKVDEKDFLAAIKRIGSVCGFTHSKAISDGLRLSCKAEVLEYAALKDDEMLKIKYLIDLGWAVKKARKFKLVGLTAGHKIRDLLERAAAQGGDYTLNILGYNVTVKLQVKN